MAKRRCTVLKIPNDLESAVCCQGLTFSSAKYSFPDRFEKIKLLFSSIMSRTNQKV